MKGIKIAVLGAGGIGRACLDVAAKKKELKVVAICDSSGYLYSAKGICVKDLKRFRPSKDPIEDIIKLKDKYDGIFVALPNLPNEFIPGVVKRFIKADYSGVFTCALKRTSAMKLMMKLSPDLRRNQNVYIAGCGATPGLLSAAAVLAAQSFTKIEDVSIWWGVGISNWDAYRSTIREDIAHLPGYTVDRAKKMTDKEVEQLLSKRDGKLVLHDMEHADDILLKKAGVVDLLSKVSVGGVMDTRHAKKPVSTTMTLTGITFEGKRSSHKFILGDETSMAANVIGPALGYMKRAIWLKKHKIYGMFGSTEFMPMVVR
ncbi:MAG: saccharopine dehydrogenase-like oxidoreductase [Candidatus Omnitrophica bacterium]|nr:saccharopine dehydrogenase-like oxidoreductase [Candidatus Omnitrophota bacterium]MBU4149213.1 saccharopine dehydrogenase-like oxidoreductase [Candidatus Omnitrophota bacterium]